MLHFSLHHNMNIDNIARLDPAHVLTHYVITYSEGKRTWRVDIWTNFKNKCAEGCSECAVLSREKI